MGYSKNALGIHIHLTSQVKFLIRIVTNHWILNSLKIKSKEEILPAYKVLSKFYLTKRVLIG